MIFTKLPLRGSLKIDLDKKEDDRGFFARYFCEKEFSDQGINLKWVQINTSLSKNKNTLRGLHFQRPPMAEDKIIRCLRGSIWDLIVDLRKNSQTFGKWFGTELNEENRTMIFVPKGFAHGFISLKPNSEILYLVSEFYSPEHEHSLNWNDKEININWPVRPKFISQKDLEAPYLKDLDPIKI